ncbi:hypothetical protein KSX_78870 [Ktedonospora formicarum]|uniref:Uncharacterized protein n=1 Tax=Ktedonospora formicarum TaxID=2778364 RepID=A0A8J3I563_9CHLR|nr:hypothetical protein KSX_78870 [Ktedonospora formicarum]
MHLRAKKLAAPTLAWMLTHAKNLVASGASSWGVKSSFGSSATENSFRQVLCAVKLIHSI